MSYGSIITTVAFVLFAGWVLYAVVNSALEKKRKERNRKHEPHSPDSGFSRAEHIRNGGMGNGGLER